MKGFIDFVREQGVVGLAVGFILGGAVSKVVAAFVADIINPLLGLVLGIAGGLKTASFSVGPANILYGDFITIVIDFLVIALVVCLWSIFMGVEGWKNLHNFFEAYSF